MSSLIDYEKINSEIAEAFRKRNNALFSENEFKREIERIFNEEIYKFADSFGAVPKIIDLKRKLSLFNKYDRSEHPVNPFIVSTLGTAFSEAVNSFNPDKGSPFTVYLTTIYQRNLLKEYEDVMTSGKGSFIVIKEGAKVAVYEEADSLSFVRGYVTNKEYSAKMVSSAIGEKFFRIDYKKAKGYIKDDPSSVSYYGGTALSLSIYSDKDDNKNEDVPEGMFESFNDENNGLTSDKNDGLIYDENGNANKAITTLSEPEDINDNIHKLLLLSYKTAYDSHNSRSVNEKIAYHQYFSETVISYLIDSALYNDRWVKKRTSLINGVMDFPWCNYILHEDVESLQDIRNSHLETYAKFFDDSDNVRQKIKSSSVKWDDKSVNHLKIFVKPDSRSETIKFPWVDFCIRYIFLIKDNVDLPINFKNMESSFNTQKKKYLQLLDFQYKKSFGKDYRDILKQVEDSASKETVIATK